jgi:hypothetical protein
MRAIAATRNAGDKAESVHIRSLLAALGAGGSRIVVEFGHGLSGTFAVALRTISQISSSVVAFGGGGSFFLICTWIPNDSRHGLQTCIDIFPTKLVGV